MTAVTPETALPPPGMRKSARDVSAASTGPIQCLGGTRSLLDRGAQRFLIDAGLAKIIAGDVEAAVRRRLRGALRQLIATIRRVRSNSARAFL